MAKPPSSFVYAEQALVSIIQEAYMKGASPARSMRGCAHRDWMASAKARYIASAGRIDEEVHQNGYPRFRPKESYKYPPYTHAYRALV
ncbi:MAG: hypothetical protein BSOLF_0759 [Candidatus Carbobacillus altaicus]|uniref:Uncharacterized protein n=1 Tax=Candidatus Carbonibacillus altaicus TaxID=2163959 RepID=A0A2R6Y0F9_9BACL|nr:MAG: hypothetical protein BSOLF_0759 [Candidatus Carbobacillus altaicus]